MGSVAALCAGHRTADADGCPHNPVPLYIDPRLGETAKVRLSASKKWPLGALFACQRGVVPAPKIYPQRKSSVGRNGFAEVPPGS